MKKIPIILCIIAVCISITGCLDNITIGSDTSTHTNESTSIEYSSSGVGNNNNGNENGRYKLNFNVKVEKNLLFSKYPVAVLVDDEKVGQISNNESSTFTTYVLPGEHVITFKKAKGFFDKKNEFSIDVQSNTGISCKLHTKKTKIEIKDWNVFTAD